MSSGSSPAGLTACSPSQKAAPTSLGNTFRNVSDGVAHLGGNGDVGSSAFFGDLRLVSIHHFRQLVCTPTTPRWSGRAQYVVERFHDLLIWPFREF